MQPLGPELRRALRGRVLVLTGSGISAESGIPTFRGEGGYWRTHKAEELATQAAFDRHPEVVWEWYQERRALIASAQPNAAHIALVNLARQCREFLLVTQNVDDLHERARAGGHGLEADQMVHIHGEIFVTRCPKCGHSRREAGGTAKEGRPRCPSCGAVMRPGVVWFDEELDPNEVRRVQEFLARGDCDAVLLIGTTATFDYIQQWALEGRGRKGWLVEINPHETEFSPRTDAVIRQRAGVALPELVRQAFAKGV